MGTRCLTYFYEDDTIQPFLCMYRQFDGYPEGHGKELGEFLEKFQIVNGFGSDAKAGESANGMGCLAAQMVAHFKKEIGNHYLVAPELQQDSWQEFEYHVYSDRVEVKSCYNEGQIIFTGCYAALAKWAAEPARTEEGDYIVSKVVKPESLRDALKEGIVEVTFRKVSDNTTRTMRCTKQTSHIPTDMMPTGNKPNTDKTLFKVWDMDKQGWRSFREDRVEKWVV